MLDRSLPVNSLLIEVEGTDGKEAKTLCAVGEICLVAVQQEIVKIWFRFHL